MGSPKGGVAIGLNHVLRLDREKMIEVAGSIGRNLLEFLQIQVVVRGSKILKFATSSKTIGFLYQLYIKLSTFRKSGCLGVLHGFGRLDKERLIHKFRAIPGRAV